MNEYEEKQNEWQEATDNWVKLTLEKYDRFEVIEGILSENK